MKITETKKIENIDFYTLDAGECFSDGDDYYLCINEIFEENDDSGAPINAILLSDGVGCHFDVHEKVFRVNAELIIN